MPFSIRRLTLQRSLSGGERPKSEPPGRAAIKKSASQDEARAARGAPLVAFRRPGGTSGGCRRSARCLHQHRYTPVLRRRAVALVDRT
ncbi:hypothetical protein MRX96_019776 [Rhipicephalus microplus]